jgi:hypothetical protein
VFAHGMEVFSRLSVMALQRRTFGVTPQVTGQPLIARNEVLEPMVPLAFEATFGD